MSITHTHTQFCPLEQFDSGLARYRWSTPDDSGLLAGTTAHVQCPPALPIDQFDEKREHHVRIGWAQVIGVYDALILELFGVASSKMPGFR